MTPTTSPPRLRRCGREVSEDDGTTMCLAPLDDDGRCPAEHRHVTDALVAWQCSECATFDLAVTTRTLPDGSKRDLCPECSAALGLRPTTSRRKQ